MSEMVPVEIEIPEPPPLEQPPKVEAAPKVDDGWEISIGGMKRTEFKKFVDLLDSDTATDADVWPYMVQVVKRWPYQYPPDSAASYDELTVDEGEELNLRIGEALATFLAAKQETRRKRLPGGQGV